MRDTGGKARCPLAAMVAGFTETDGMALGAAVTGATFKLGSGSGVTSTVSTFDLLDEGGKRESITAMSRSVKDSSISSRPD